MKKKLICTLIIGIIVLLLSLVNRDNRIKKAKEEPVLFGQILPFWARNLEPNDCVYWGLTNHLTFQEKYGNIVYFSDKNGNNFVFFRRSDGEWILIVKNLNR